MVRSDRCPREIRASSLGGGSSFSVPEQADTSALSRRDRSYRSFTWGSGRLLPQRFGRCCGLFNCRRGDGLLTFPRFHAVRNQGGARARFLAARPVGRGYKFPRLRNGDLLQLHLAGTGQSPGRRSLQPASADYAAFPPGIAGPFAGSPPVPRSRCRESNHPDPPLFPSFALHHA